MKYSQDKKKVFAKGSSFALTPKKNLGQHLLVNESVLEVMVDALKKELNPSLGVCHEIGPGGGVLTRVLLKNGYEVYAVDKDKESVEGLKRTLLQEYPDIFNVAYGDALRWLFDFDEKKEYASVGNIPYNITSDILMNYIQNIRKYKCALYMMQKEVADRIIALPGTKSYGRLSVRMQLYCSIERLIDVGPESFVPPPQVDSTVLLFKPSGRFLEPLVDKAFESFTATLFGQRRKMLRKIFKSFYPKLAEDAFWEWAKDFSVFEQQRCEELSWDTLFRIFCYNEGYIFEDILKYHEI